MSITATELKENLGKYLALASTEDIYVTKNGRAIAKISSPHQDRVEAMKSIFGIIPADQRISPDEARYERLTKKLGYRV